MVGQPAFAGFPFPGEASDAVPIPASGLALWLDAARGIALDGATARVTAWTSRAGSVVATQGTTAAMPTVSSMNGLPSLSFDGADDALAASAAPTLGDASTAFVVFQVPAGSGYRSMVGGSAAGGYELNLKPGNVLRLRASSGGDIVFTSSGAVPTAVPVQACVTLNRNGGSNGSASIRVNRTVAVSTSGLAVASAFSSATDRIGTTASGDRMSGLVSEILLYGRVLSASEIARVEVYLQAKWGTA